MSTRRLRTALLVAAFSCSALAEPPNDGLLDTSWNSPHGGKALIGFNYGEYKSDIASASVVGADGSMYIAGTVTGVDGYPRMGLTKLVPNGHIDTGGFGDGGRVTSAAGFHATSLALRNNTLYVGGYKDIAMSGREFAFCIFSLNGVPLLFPGTLSSCATASLGVFQQISDARAYGIAVRSDGKVVLGGEAKGNAGTHAAFARFNTDGTLDESFGTTVGRTFLLGPGYSNHFIQSIALQGNGKILGAGSTQLVGRSDKAGLVVTLTEDGIPDLSVPEADIELDGSTERDTVFSDVIAVDDPIVTDDDALVVGFAETSGVTQSGVIAKIRPNGNLEDDFSVGPGDMTPGYDVFSLGNDTEFKAIAVQPGVGYLVAGKVLPPGNELYEAELIVRRYLPSGQIDQDYGVGTQISFLPEAMLAQIADVSFNGRGIYVAGTAYADISASQDFTAAKITLDRIFADGFEN